MCYVAGGEVSEPCVHAIVAVGEVLEPCRSTAVGAAWILLTLSCFRRGFESNPTSWAHAGNHHYLLPE